MKHEELIQKYVQETLNEEEQQLFSNLLQQDTNFAQAVTEYENIHKAIKFEEKQKLKSHLQNIEATVALETNESKPSRNYKKLAIAVVLILFFGLLGNYIVQQSNRHETLYATYFEPYPNALLPVTRSETNASELAAAIRSYEAKDFEKAATQFEAILAKQNQPDVEIWFYKAMSLLNAGKDNEALDALRTIKHSETRFTPQIYWYGALLHVKFKENEKALKALQYMDSINTTYKKAAREVLKAELQ